MNLTTAPTDFDVNTIFIDLQFNEIDVFSNYIFTNLPKLETINVAHNAISVIQPYAFYNCNALEELHFEYNKLTFTSESVPLQIYQSLTRLKGFYVHFNKGNTVGTFPTPICTYLTNLDSLSIDIYGHTTFPTECSRMVHLRWIYLVVSELLYLQNIKAVTHDATSLMRLVAEKF